MAEHTITHYSCDVCGVDLGAKKPVTNGRVLAGFEAEWAMEAVFEWKDMCKTCRDGALHALKNFKASRRASPPSQYPKIQKGE